jgi:hypothetical protein
MGVMLITLPPVRVSLYSIIYCCYFVNFPLRILKIFAKLNEAHGRSNDSRMSCVFM